MYRVGTGYVPYISNSTLIFRYYGSTEPYITLLYPTLALPYLYPAIPLPYPPVPAIPALNASGPKSVVSRGPAVNNPRNSAQRPNIALQPTSQNQNINMALRIVYPARKTILHLC